MRVTNRRLATVINYIHTVYKQFHTRRIRPCFLGHKEFRWGKTNTILPKRKKDKTNVCTTYNSVF